MKRIFKIFGVVLLIIIAGVAIFIMTYQPKKYSDFGVFVDLRSHVLTVLKEYRATERPVTQDFQGFTIFAVHFARGRAVSKRNHVVVWISGVV